MQSYNINKDLTNFWIKYFCDYDFAYSVQQSIPNFDKVIAQTNVAVMNGDAMPLPEYIKAYNVYCDKCFE